MTEIRRQWQIYELLSSRLLHCHTRWVDNYRVFLSFNAILLPGNTAILGFAMKESQYGLFSFMILFLSIMGIIATVCGIYLMRRIQIDTDLRHNQLKRLEVELTWLPVKPFTEGFTLFHEKQDVKDKNGNVVFEKKNLQKRNLPASIAYETISWSIVVFYFALMTITAIWNY
jgi:hypothetical protein